jgi:hypothetical protein
MAPFLATKFELKALAWALRWITLEQGAGDNPLSRVPGTSVQNA